MVPNRDLLNFLRQLGFKFSAQKKRANIYKQRGSTRRLAIRRKRMHDLDSVGRTLKSAGVPEKDIEAFLQTFASPDG